MSNGVLSNFVGSGTTYTATLTPSSAGPVTVDIAAAQFTDLSGQINIAAEQFNWTHQVFCAANQRVQDNACVACAAGTTNESGDDASGANSLCDDTICGVDQYVSANTCTACPAGTTNTDGGDNAAGEDTACDDTICGVDQYVSANTCTACPAGTTNTDGDNASGTNTVCQSSDFPARSCNGHYRYLAGPDGLGINGVYDGDLDSVFDDADIAFVSPFSDNGQQAPSLNAAQGDWGNITALQAGTPTANATQTYNESDGLGAIGEAFVYTFRLEGNRHRQRRRVCRRRQS